MKCLTLNIQNLHGVLWAAVKVLMLLSVSVNAHSDVLLSANTRVGIFDNSPNPSITRDINGVSIFQRISDNNRELSPISGTVSDLAIELLAPPTGIISTVASAGYTARGDNGNLGVSVDSWAATPSTNPYTFLSSSASVILFLTANDRITVTSSTLAAGALTSIDVSGLFEGSVFGNILDATSSRLASSVSSVEASFQIYELTSTGSFGANFFFSNCFSFGSVGSRCNQVPYFFDAYSRMLEVRVGSTLVIDTNLVAQSQSFANPIGGFLALEGRSEANSLNTLSTYLTPTTEGVRLLAESGFDYTRPTVIPTGVPEPGTWILMLSGLMLIPRFVKSRR